MEYTGCKGTRLMEDARYCIETLRHNLLDRNEWWTPAEYDASEAQAMRRRLKRMLERMECELATLRSWEQRALERKPLPKQRWKHWIDSGVSEPRGRNAP